MVDSTNFTDKTNFRGSTENLHIVERFTRLDADTILYEFTLDDPATWTRPWKGEYLMARIQGPIYEFACHEGNYGLANILLGRPSLRRARRAGCSPSRSSLRGRRTRRSGPASSPRDFGRPGPGPGGGILDRERVVDRVRVDAREPLVDVQRRRGDSEPRLVVEVGRVDDQRVAFPVAARVAVPLADALPTWRTRAVDRESAARVNHLGADTT